MKDIIIDIVFCIIDTLIIMYFFDNKFNRHSLNSISSLLPIFFILLTADICITFLKIPTLLQLLVFFILCEFVLLFFYNGNMIKKTYSVIIAILLTIIPSLLILYIMSWVSDVNFISLVNNNNFLKIITNTISKFLQLLTIKMALIKPKNEESRTVDKTKIIIFAVIMILSILTITYIRNSLSKEIINTNFCIYATISIIIIDLISYALISFYSEFHQNKMDMEMQRLTIQQQQKEIENVIKEYYETLKIRHDIDKYLNIAIEMMHEKEYDRLETYLKSFKNDKLGNVKTYINTKNKMFNAIINQKLSEAEKSKIKIECFISDDLADFTGMDDLELCLIFLNLLDNAIEAEKNIDAPIIKLNIFQNAGYTCFKIENIVDKDVLSINPTLKTTKNNNRIHGIGLRSVREIIDNHDGIFNITQNDKWFSVEIMLLKSII